VACQLPINPSVNSAALRDGCCVSRPAWWMLAVLDCAVCLQSDERRLLLVNVRTDLVQSMQEYSNERVLPWSDASLSVADTASWWLQMMLI